MADKDKKRDPMPPPDATPEEVGEFWDTHSLADYWDETHEVEVQVNLKSRQDLSPDETEVVDQSNTLSAELGWHELKKLIQKMGNDGKDFEKLVATLLTSFLNIPFVVARSGDQPRGDARSMTGEVAIQAKKYSDKTALRAVEIVGDIDRVRRNLQDLQVYVLVISRDTDEQLLSELEDIEKDTGLDIVVLELTDNLSDLGALCITFWEDIHEFFDPSDTNQQFLDWVGIEQDKLETTKKISELRDKLKYRIQTQKHIHEDIEKYLLERFSRSEGFNPINLSQAIERKSLESKLTNWWETEESPICCLEGKGGHGKTWLASKWMNSICQNENIVAFWLDSKDWKGHKSIFDLLYTCFSLIYPSYEQGKIVKLQNKPAKIWRKTLIVLDGVNERDALETADRILSEYFRHENEWGSRIRFLLTTRPLNDYPDSWSRCHEISVDHFNDSELQKMLILNGLQPDDLPNSLKDTARIPRYFQRCLELRDELGSFAVVTPEMVLLADLTDKIKRSDQQIKQKLGWIRPEDPKDFFLNLAKQIAWDKIDAAPERLGQLLKGCFSDYSEIRRDLEEQRIVSKAGLFDAKLSADYVLLCWTLYLSHLFDNTKSTRIEDLLEHFQQELEPILSEDLRTEALFAALQLSAIFPNTDLAQEQLSQKRAALMLAWFNSHNARITDGRLSFWANKDTDAYAQVIEVEFNRHNAPKYEEMLIEPLAKTWLDEKGQLDRLASRLKKWLLPTHSVNSPENREYTDFKGNHIPKKNYDPQVQLSAAALSILSQNPKPEFLETLARCYEILEGYENLDRRDIGVLMRWGYTEKVLEDLYSLAEQSPSDTQLLKGVCRLVDCFRIGLPSNLERTLSKEDMEKRAFIEQYTPIFNPFINDIRNQKRLLTGDSPEVNANRGYFGLDCLAVRKDLPAWCDEDQNEITKISHYISDNLERGVSKDLIPWIAKYAPEGYRELSCNLKINALNPEHPPYALRVSQELIFQQDDRERITEAILKMKEYLVQGDDSALERARVLTEILLFSASGDKLIDWFKFLASHESLRKSIFTETLQVLLNKLLSEPVVRFVQQKLKTLRSPSLDNQFPSNIESEKITEEDFWWWIYLCISDDDENTITWTLENLKRRKSNLHSITFYSLYKATLDSNQFLSEVLTDKDVRKHLFLKDGRFFTTPIYNGENPHSYEYLVSVLPQEVVGSFLCSPTRHADLSRWGKELMELKYSILQGATVNFDYNQEMRFLVNPEVLRIWAEQDTPDFLCLADKYLTMLFKSSRYHQVSRKFTEAVFRLFLRFQPDEAMKYYRQWNAENFQPVYANPYGIPTHVFQLWHVEDFNLSEHHNLRCRLLEECLNDEEIMFMTFAALVGGGKKELWDLVTQKYLVSSYAKQRNLGVSILPWFGTDKAIEKLDQLKSSDQSQWVRGHAAWAYEVAQQERSCQEAYREVLQAGDLFSISAVLEQIEPALSPIARWWHCEIEKKANIIELQDSNPKLFVLLYRFWERWENSSQTRSNVEVFDRKLREYCRGERSLAGRTPRIAPWWKPTSDFGS